MKRLCASSTAARASSTTAICPAEDAIVDDLGCVFDCCSKFETCLLSGVLYIHQGCRLYSTW